MVRVRLKVLNAILRNYTLSSVIRAAASTYICYLNRGKGYIGPARVSKLEYFRCPILSPDLRGRRRSFLILSITRLKTVSTQSRRYKGQRFGLSVVP